MEKIIKLEDFNNKPLEDIIELYKSGYILEAQPSISQISISQPSISQISISQPSISQPSIQQLQLPKYTTSIAILLAGIFIGFKIWLILKKRK